MLTVERLTKTYGEKAAVNHISFSVGDGEVLGFLGPNGAGKSTTMNMITGYLGANEGRVLIDGTDMLEDPLQAKCKIGYLPEKPPLYPEMSVSGYLRFVFQLKKLRLPREEHIAEICRLIHIDHVANRVIRNLSKGYQQRVGIAQAMLGYPQLLILDEPTVGLDPKQIIEIRELIASLGTRQTVILSSHILSEVQSVCSRILVMDQGRIMADCSTGEMTSSAGKLHVSVCGERRAAKDALQSLPGVLVEDMGREKEPGVFEFVLTPPSGEDIRAAMFELLARRGMPIYALENAGRSLEDVFLALTQQEIWEGMK